MKGKIIWIRDLAGELIFKGNNRVQNWKVNIFKCGMKIFYVIFVL